MGNRPVLFSVEVDGVSYDLANNRNVVKNAAQKEPAAFDSLLKKKSVDTESFADVLKSADVVNIVMETLFAYAIKEYNDMPYEEACNIFEVVYFNIKDDQEQLEAFTNKIMSLIQSTDFIKGSNQRKASVKLKF